MKIDGKAIAERILDELATEVNELKEKGVTPTLAVILVGDNPASLAYIRQKQKATERTGATLLLNHESGIMNHEALHDLIQQYNSDPNVHGLIVQRPLPKEMGDVKDILNTISPIKDVDGFVPNSPFEVPVAAAVGKILQKIYESINEKSTNENSKFKIQNSKFLIWLRSKNIVVIGRGETAGKPIADYLSNLDCATSIVHSQTPNPKGIIKKADIIISCVGKERVVTKEMLKSDAVLIGVGIWRDTKGKLGGDYNEEEIADTASFYTPTPGGVGPVNVACLMRNLVTAAKRQTT